MCVATTKYFSKIEFRSNFKQVREPKIRILTEEKSAKSTKNHAIIPLTVFLFSISIVLISFVSVIFPALILASSTVTIPGIAPVTPDPFETGVWSGGVVISSIILFGLALLHHKKKIPSLSKLFEKIFNFEISKKTALIAMIVLLGIYVASSVNELSAEEKFEDYIGVKNRVDIWNISQVSNVSEPHVNYFFLKSSMILFGNYKIIPFLASISLLLVTYFLTKKIAQKRFAAIIAVIILLQSNLFLTYDTSVAYSNFWILFYLLSLYLAYRFWPLSPISYLVSIPAKALTAAFLPMSIYFVLRSDISKKRKIIVASFTTVIIVIVGIAATSVSLGEAKQESFDAKELQMGFTSFSYQLRSDGLVILFMIPLVSGLFILSKRGIKHAESIMVLISGILLITPILTGFTNQTNQPYRFVPLVVFFAVGVGVLLSKRVPPD